jgi:hypothetical protein
MEPELVSAQNLSPGDIGQFAWDTTLNIHDLEYRAEGLCATWKQLYMAPGAVAPRIWVPVQSLARLHSGDFRWSFRVADIGEGQIGVGFMLDWTIGPDWGFYGYLGSSSSAWAYDPTSGDVVIGTRSIEGGLPVFENGHGVVTVEAHLPREESGLVRFLVDRRSSNAIELPVGAVLVPAACFLSVGQTVILADLSTEALEPSQWRRAIPADEPEAIHPTTRKQEQDVPNQPSFLNRLKNRFFGS